MKWNMTRRATLALVTSGVSLFLLICFAGYGARTAEAVGTPLGFSGTIASWFVTPLGAGAHVIALLAFAWGVVVYFQEKTPDLVLRLVGTTTLAASTAMVFGLLHSDRSSVWAGWVGTAGARALSSHGVFVHVLGWFAVVALLVISSVFATDWLFRTLRRGNTPVFDPRKLPTEPARSEFLDDATQTQPREFVREKSRAAEVSPSVASHERVSEALPTTLPVKFADEGDDGGRTRVRALVGYDGVEFLPTSDELALPEMPANDVYAHALAGLVDDDLSVGETVSDPVAVRAEPRVAAEDEAPTTAARNVERAPAGPAIGPDGIPDEEPRSGIALADASILVDEVFTFSPLADDADGPHDGASAAAEIAGLSPPTGEVAPAPAAPAAAAPAPRIEVPEPVEARFEDDVVDVRFAVFEDEEFVPDARVESPPAPTEFPPAAQQPSFEPSPAVAVAERAAPMTIGAPQAAVEPAPEPAEFVEEDAPLFGEDSYVAFEETPAASAPEAVEEPVVAEREELAVAEPAIEPAISTQSFEAEPVVEEAETPMLEEPVAAEYDEPAFAEPAIEPAVAAPSFEAEPVTEEPALPALETPAEVPVAFETSPAAAEVATPAPEPTPAPAPAAAPEKSTEQLRLFAPTCDLSRLASMELDPLFHDAVKAVLARGRASAVVLQRALGIGYARGLRILDQMTDAGMLGPDSPGGAREICFTQEQWEARG